MLTVPEAARLVGRDPETVRRWIRSGRLRSAKVGTQHLIDEDDLESLIAETHQELPVPKAWREDPDGRATANVVRWVHVSRHGR